MYLGHLTAYRRALLERIGGFRKEFDLSQDYDFALRATERLARSCICPRALSLARTSRVRIGRRKTRSARK